MNLTGYLIFESEDELQYVQGIKLQLDKLFDEINTAEICYPGTDLRMTYELVSKCSG